MTSIPKLECWKRTRSLGIWWERVTCLGKGRHQNKKITDIVKTVLSEVGGVAVFHQFLKKYFRENNFKGRGSWFRFLTVISDFFLIFGSCGTKNPGISKIFFKNCNKMKWILLKTPLCTAYFAITIPYPDKR